MSAPHNPGTCTPLCDPCTTRLAQMSVAVMLTQADVDLILAGTCPTCGNWCNACARLTCHCGEHPELEDPMPTPPKLTPMDAQKAAQTFAHDYIAKHALGLNELPDAQFPKAMDAITRALVEAWGDGYYTGVAG